MPPAHGMKKIQVLSEKILQTGPRRRRSAKHPFLSRHASVGDHSAENMRPTNEKDACIERRRQKRDGEQATDVAEMG